MQEAIVYTNISLVGTLLVLFLSYTHSINARSMNHVKLTFNPWTYSSIRIYRRLSYWRLLRSAHTAVFMCFVWISEQTAIISLYNINWLVCITETECVYCAVRTGSLYALQANRSPSSANGSFHTIRGPTRINKSLPSTLHRPRATSMLENDVSAFGSRRPLTLFWSKLLCYLGQPSCARTADCLLSLSKTLAVTEATNVLGTESMFLKEV